MTVRRSILAAAGVLAASSTASAQGSLPDSLARRVDAVFAKFAPTGPGLRRGRLSESVGSRTPRATAWRTSSSRRRSRRKRRSSWARCRSSSPLRRSRCSSSRGKVSLDDDVHKYVPELADYGKKITIGQLVHHTSGIRDFWALVDAAGMRPDDGYTVADILTLASRQKHLNFEPGAEYNYSNTGYVLLGVIVQRVTGKTLRQFAAEQIFTPLGMTSSHFHDDHNEPVRGRAAAYSPSTEPTASTAGRPTSGTTTSSGRAV